MSLKSYSMLRKMVVEFYISSRKIQGPLNLKLTMESEQFTNSNWRRLQDNYRTLMKTEEGLIGLEVRQEGSVEKPKLCVKIYCTKRFDDVNFVKARLVREFGLDHNLESVYRELGEDPIAKKIVNRYRGLRLVRYIDPEECLITYHLSTNTTIQRLEQMLESLKKRFGETFKFDDGFVLKTFPKIQNLFDVNLKTLENCKLGYKSKFLLELVNFLRQNPIDWEKLKNLSIDEARKMLMKLPGVGLKVADAVLLYGLGQTETFPIDIWVRRALVRLYGLNSNLSYQQLQKFVKEKFGEYSGYLEPYLFCFGRSKPF